MTKASYEASLVKSGTGGPKQLTLESTLKRGFTQERFEEILMKLMIATQTPFNFVNASIIPGDGALLKR